jgi:hypothetical protein
VPIECHPSTSNCNPGPGVAAQHAVIFSWAGRFSKNRA